MKSINQGLTNSKYGIVVLSKGFFGRSWPEAELAALFNMMLNSKRDTLLPLRHGINQKELIEKAPLLSDIVNRSSDVGIDALSQEFYGIVKGQVVKSSSNSNVRLTDGPIVQIVNFGVESPASLSADSRKYHPNLRNDGNTTVNNIRIYYKIMDHTVSLNDIVRQKKDIQSRVVLYEGSIFPTGSARVDAVDLPGTENETSAIFWLVYDFGENESTEIVF